MTGFQGNSVALCLQVPVPAPTVSPCKAIDPNCVDCANNVCTACNIIFTLDDATKKCGEPQSMPCAQCISDLAAACHSIVTQLPTVADARWCAVQSCLLEQLYCCRERRIYFVADTDTREVHT